MFVLSFPAAPGESAARMKHSDSSDEVRVFERRNGEIKEGAGKENGPEEAELILHTS